MRQIRLWIAYALASLSLTAHALPDCAAPEPWTFQGGLFLEGDAPHIVFNSPFTGDFSRYFFDRNSKVGKRILSSCNETAPCWIRGKVCSKDVSLPDTSWAAQIVSVDQIRKIPPGILVEEIFGRTACKNKRCQINDVGAAGGKGLLGNNEVVARYIFDAESKVGRRILRNCKRGQACRVDADVKMLEEDDANPDPATYVPTFSIESVSMARKANLRK
jgi:hypothetical protein